MINYAILYFSPTKVHTIPASLNTLQFGNQVINRVYHGKYLGLILEESLNWNEHIESLIKQLSKIANPYKVVKHHVEKDNKCNIYFAYTCYMVLKFMGVHVTNT